MVFVLKSTHNCVGDPKRKFKGRGALLGNQVKNESFEAAMFQDLGNSPASFEASHWADFWVVMTVGTCRWPMPRRHTFRPHCEARHVGSNCLRGCAE